MLSLSMRHGKSAARLSVGLVWALRVRGRRHGQPGTLVKSYPAVGLPERMLGQADCSTAPTGWKLQDGQLQAPSDGSDGGAEPLCVGGQEWSLAPYVGCPPTTRHGGVTSCGLHGAAELQPGSKDLAGRSGERRAGTEQQQQGSVVSLCCESFDGRAPT